MNGVSAGEKAGSAGEGKQAGSGKKRGRPRNATAFLSPSVPGFVGGTSTATEVHAPEKRVLATRSKPMTQAEIEQVAVLTAAVTLLRGVADKMGVDPEAIGMGDVVGTEKRWPASPLIPLPRWNEAFEFPSVTKMRSIYRRQGIGKVFVKDTSENVWIDWRAFWTQYGYKGAM